MIEVYYAPPSIYGRKVLAVLLEKDLDFEIKPLSFKTQDYLQPEYLKLNPNGEVPTIVDEDRVIYESTTIGEYLDEEYPEPPLMPAGPYERAQVRMIEDFCDLHLYRSLVKCIIKKLRTQEEITEQEKAAVAGNFKRIETYLGKKNFLVGEFSLADCAFMAAIPTAEELGFEVALQTPALKSYVARLKARPSFKGALMISSESIQDRIAKTEAVK